MIKVVTKEEMRLIDEYTIKYICPEYDLIKKAGKVLYDSFSYPGKTVVVLGKGNNASDGIVLAILLKEANKDVTLLKTCDISKDVVNNLLNEAISKNICVLDYTPDFNFDIYNNIVDGIYGTGFKGDVYDEKIIEVINKINNSNKHVISIDINSGLDANSGKTKLCVHSDLTVCMGYIKYGELLQDAKDVIKELICKDVGMVDTENCSLLYKEEDFYNNMPHRLNNSNKGTYGYCGVFGGSNLYRGAIKLANMSLASLLSGCGVSRIIAPDYFSESLDKYLLESTYYPIKSNQSNIIFDKDNIDSAVKGLTSLSFGMGIGLSNIVKQILEYILLTFKGRLLIDADGLNNLSSMDLELLNKSGADIILTPHIKEFSRLTCVSVDEITSNPILYVKKFVHKYNVTLLLKGTSTIIASKDCSYILPIGGPELAKGGSGDILSGIICGMMGYMSPIDAALNGSTLFSLCGKRARKKNGVYSVLGRDIIKEIKNVLRDIK